MPFGLRESVRDDNPAHGIQGEAVMTAHDLDVFGLCMAAGL